MWNNASSINQRVTEEERRLLDSFGKETKERGHQLNYLHREHQEKSNGTIQERTE